MRSLRLWLLAAFIFFAVVPVLTVGYWAREQLVAQTQAGYDAQLERAASLAQARVAEQAAADERRLRRLCDGDFLVDRLLLDLATDQFGPTREQELVTLTPTLMSSLGFDALVIVDARGGSARRGRVLASGHFPSRAGALDPGLVDALVRAEGRPFVRDVRVQQEAGAADRRTVLHGCTADRDGVQLAVLGGRLLTDEYGERLHGSVGDIRLVMTGPDGVLPDDVAAGGGRAPVHTFHDAGGAPAAQLVAAADDTRLLQQLEELNTGYAIALGISFVIAMLMAVFFYTGFSRSLRPVEAALARVAAGDLETTTESGGRGEVRRLMDQVNDMTLQLRRTREQLLRAERIAAWQEIARHIAHEVKNPLSPIQVSIETMRKTYARKHPDFEEIFDESTLAILEEVERLKRLVTEFSRFARLPRPKPERLDIREVVEHVASLHGEGVELTIDAEDTEPIRADREQLTQVLMNLVQNAVAAAQARHGGRGGKVLVLVEAADEGVVVRVQDNGPGIPADQRRRVFEPYFTTKSDGTGLGLAVCYRIVGDHGGGIEADEGPEGGAELRMYLPASGPPQEIEASATDTIVPLVQRRS